MTTQSRDRQRGSYQNRIAQYVLYNANGTVFSTTTTTQPVGTVETMRDTVHRPFVPGRTLANAAMRKTTITKDARPASGRTDLVQVPTYTGANKAMGEQFVDRSAAMTALTSTLGNFDYTSLVSLASTKALAGVRKPELSGFVTIAEWRSTVQSLLNPLNGALKLLSKITPSRKLKKSRARQSKKQRVQMALKDASDQHLTVVFGLLPFISDIQGILKALQAPNPLPTRFTSRGEASSSDQKSKHEEVIVYNDGNNVGKNIYDDVAKRTVTVRAYQLYETSITLQNALGLSVQDIPKAIWQAATLSFVVDWFVNVGDFISALAPVAGVEYLLSGYTVTVVDATTSDYKIVTTHSQTYGWTGAYLGGQQVLVSIVKERVPGSLFNHIGLAFKSNMHRDVLDTFKVTAAISLITQKLKRF